MIFRLASRLGFSARAPSRLAPPGWHLKHATARASCRLTFRFALFYNLAKQRAVLQVREHAQCSY